MKTNNIPALITLSAGAVYCVVGLSQHLTGFEFAKELLIVLIIFFVIGTIVKIILDANFKDFNDMEETQEETSEETEEREDISTEGQEASPEASEEEVER